MKQAEASSVVVVVLVVHMFDRTRMLAVVVVVLIGNMLDMARTIAGTLGQAMLVITPQAALPHPFFL